MDQLACKNGNGIPVIDLSPEIERGTESWQQLCKWVRDACESYGCFEVIYHKVPKQIREEAFSLMREMFELPLEIKKKNSNPKPYHSYYGGSALAPLYESFGIEDVSNIESLESFTHLMWPQGHHQFVETISSMIEEVEKLHRKIGALILDSWGVGGTSMMECKTLLRLMRYKAPPNGEPTEGLLGHTDKFLCVLLWGNQVSGLQVQTEDGQWIQVIPSDNSFVFVVGDPLLAWSNGRFNAAKHRVKMSGSKDRLSLGAFLVPVEGTIIKPPKEMVDEQHPRIFGDFDFMDFAIFSMTPEATALGPGGQLKRFAGL